jgi:hypothetical protein
MSFDARSLDRLKALGRTLPTPLPPPEPPAPAAEPSGAGSRLHRLETENDPEQLFRELIAASPDGSVPPHLMERLRDLEQRRSMPAASASKGAPGRAPAPASEVVNGQQSRRRSAEEMQQYATFAHLLLEQVDEG